MSEVLKPVSNSCMITVIIKPSGSKLHTSSSIQHLSVKLGQVLWLPLSGVTHSLSVC